jgi:hypothetical protein
VERTSAHKLFENGNRLMHDSLDSTCSLVVLARSLDSAIPTKRTGLVEAQFWLTGSQMA